VRPQGVHSAESNGTSGRCSHRDLTSLHLTAHFTQHHRAVMLGLRNALIGLQQADSSP
jgi:hypothetical protein